MIEHAQRAQELLDSLVEERGGISKFSRVQVELAVAATRLMGLMRGAAAGDIVKTATALSAILDKLPPVVAGSSRPVERITRDMPLQELANAYSRFLQDRGEIDWDVDPRESPARICTRKLVTA